MLHTGMGRLPPGLLAPLLAVGCTWGAEPPAGPRGEPALAVTLPASTVTLEPRATERLDAQVRAVAGTPPGTPLAVGYRTAEPCIAAVRADGVVIAGRTGTTVVEAYAVAAPRTARAAVTVTVRRPAVLRLALRSLTAGDPPTLLDPTQPIGGTFTATVNVDAGLATTSGARLDLLLDGRLVGSAPVAPSSGDVVSVSIPVNSAARDPATGTPLFANGVRPLRANLVVPVPDQPGCPALDVGEGGTLVTLLLRNP